MANWDFDRDGGVSRAAYEHCRPTIDGLERDNARLREENGRLKAELVRLRLRLDDALDKAEGLVLDSTCL